MASRHFWLCGKCSEVNVFEHHPGVGMKIESRPKELREKPALAFVTAASRCDCCRPERAPSLGKTCSAPCITEADQDPLRVSDPNHLLATSCSSIISAGSKTIGQARDRPIKQLSLALCNRRLPSPFCSARAIVSLGRITTSRKRQPP